MIVSRLCMEHQFKNQPHCDLAGLVYYLETVNAAAVLSCRWVQFNMSPSLWVSLTVPGVFFNGHFELQILKHNVRVESLTVRVS